MDLPETKAISPNQILSERFDDLDNSGKIELAPSKDLGHSRRNLLFCTTLLFIFVAGKTTAVSIPGFFDLRLEPSLAMIGLSAASLFFAYEYYLEYRLTRLRNSPLLSPSSAESIDQAVRRFEIVIKSMVSEIEMHARNSDEQIKLLFGSNDNNSAPSLSTTVEEMRAHLLSLRSQGHLFPNSPPEAVNALSYNVFLASQKIEVELSKAKALANLNLDEALSGRNSLSEAIKRSTKGAEQWVEALDSVSKTVLSFQRRAFRWKDGLVPTYFLFGTLALTAYRLFERRDIALATVEWPAALSTLFGVLVGGVGMWISRVYKRNRIAR